jgi:hypothetical protein
MPYATAQMRDRQPTVYTWPNPQHAADLAGVFASYRTFIGSLFAEQTFTE